jgi:hypothetical protein
MEKVKYQCVWTGKMYNSAEEAYKDPKCIGPLQPVGQGVKSFAKRGIFGTEVKR